MLPPSHLSAEAVRCLRALAEAGLGEAISIGGAAGLLHHLDYRPTHDIDAWWNPRSSREARQAVLDVVRRTLAADGEVRERSWGDVVSLELRRGGRTVFSFQVAARSAQLEAPRPASWIPVLLDSFADLVASKMVALVERGAPRDFRDVHALCTAGLITPAGCWELWLRRQRSAGSDPDPARARLAVETHLERIRGHRPLEAIADAARRQEAAERREWFRTELLEPLLD